MLPDFLGRRGFAVVSDERVRNGHTIVATAPIGDRLSMRVRICWRRDPGRGDSSIAKTFSAAQLMASVGKDDWLVALRKKASREQSQGITHLLIVQNDNEHIVYAALVPLQDVLPIWTAQRDTSARLIAEGRLGRRRKNHAMNGVSPTLWLQDDRAPEVARELWSYPGVRDLAKIKADAWTGLSLPDGEANRAGIENEAKYDPTDDDQRKVIERQIRERRGQQHFRDILRERHGDRCLVTGCTVLAVLEAAHIKPYRGEQDNHPENGLLLRSDIHTLFDLDLLGIAPDRLQVELHPSLRTEYGNLVGLQLGCPPDHRPSSEALKLRYKLFLKKLDAPA
jgi:5-methylcytosine-specific restriction protein A